MTMFLSFLTLLLQRAPELTSVYREIFTEVGGNEEDFDAILTKIQKKIDRLGDPDSFRTKGKRS